MHESGANTLVRIRAQHEYNANHLVRIPGTLELDATDLVLKVNHPEHDDNQLDQNSDHLG